MGIEKDRVKEANPHQQAGLKVVGLQTAGIGDLVECLEITEKDLGRTWQSEEGVLKQT